MDAPGPRKRHRALNPSTPNRMTQGPKKPQRQKTRKDESIVFTRARNDPFARVPKDVLQLPGLSFKAKGIMSYLLSKPPEWEIRMKDIQNHGKESRDAIRGGLNELRAIGYASYQKIREADGRFMGKWRISDAPIFPPETDFPALDNPPLSKNEFSENEKRLILPEISDCAGHCGICIRCLSEGNERQWS